MGSDSGMPAPAALAGRVCRCATLAEAVEISAGDFVGFWSGDHVSPASRLRQQVAEAQRCGGAVVLRFSWVFDPSMKIFSRVEQQMPSEAKKDMAQELTKVEQNISFAKGFFSEASSMDAQTLCGLCDVV